MAHILIVDDDPAILELIKESLWKDGHAVSAYHSPADVDMKTLHRYELILLDIMMPGVDGLSFCKQIRGMVDCPILFLTAKAMEDDILYGLNIGGDDYITKPFSVKELRARLSAHLRREKREKHSALCCGKEAWLDLSAMRLYISDQPISLTKGEYAICEYLARHMGQVFTKEQIYEAVFGLEGTSDNSTIATHIMNIRCKFEPFGVSPIRTVWGIGYKWEWIEKRR